MMIYLTTVALGTLGAFFLAYVTEYLFTLKDQDKEPRRLQPKVPLIGHILGLIQSGPSYHNELRSRLDGEIFAIGILHFKLYTSVSTRLLPAIQRQSKQLSFLPMLQHVAKRWGDASDKTQQIFGGPHCASDFSRAMRLSLAPGPNLDEMNERMGMQALREIAILSSEAAEFLSDNNGKPFRILFLQWARHAVTQASSCGVYGRYHPFLDAEVENAFWKWHTYLSAHITGLNFDILGKGYAARQKVFDAHTRYCLEVPQDASFLFRERWRVLQEAGVSEEDCIKAQATLPIGMLSNTVPTFYWTVWELFSRPQLLSEVRDELEKQAIAKLEDGGFALDVNALKTECTLLISVFQETQRIRHIHAAIRKVMQDTMLDDRYFLKAGNYLQMPGQAIHYDKKIWGPSAREFDAYRFVNPQKKHGGSSFLAWGAPPHLCPARQFAATEILIMVALLTMQVDLYPARGKWQNNPTLEFNDPITVLNPKKDVAMNVLARPEWAGRWMLHMSQSTTRVPLASG